ncbi:hypothetical protein SBFV2_gp24 [Sulfolobales Beppu filamentous virus 2]|uniref:Uncharacterized protein n=1 Tax=Sulfolobales Beppu filamentous virus 2 TaxID=2493123 RepID=A0A3Q8Q3R4_9VIRU|nr:hypothetical protein HOU84_gp24 [Sulfolobales Beppu filamentous virus 2]AZI75791.1 hypothetical protein SBFV2_gp24 [Sulfolobales Beppu filamentous virus 2]
MEYCKKMKVRLIKQPDAVTWDELEHSPDITRYEILERDPFFTWKAVALVCFKRPVYTVYDLSKEELFAEIYKIYRGLQTLAESMVPYEYVFLIKYKHQRFGNQVLYEYIHG